MAESKRREIRRAILALGDARYGWDGDKALPARPDSLEFASQLFGALGLWGVKELDRLPSYDIALNQDGTIQVDFGNEGEKHLYLTFECVGVISHVREFEDGDTAIEGVIKSSFPWDDRSEYAELLDIVQWLCQE